MEVNRNDIGALIFGIELNFPQHVGPEKTREAVKIVRDMEKQIEAQQQEIWEARQDRDSQQRIAIREMGKVKTLTADKDEQAGRIVRLENLLRRIRPILRTSDIYRHALAAIDALLGGAEDETNPV